MEKGIIVKQQSMRKVLKNVLLGFLCTGVAIGEMGCSRLMYRPGKEIRTINTDMYELAVQKNGQCEIYLASGHKVFDNAIAAVEFADRDKPRALFVNPRFEASQVVRDRLGEGHGMSFTQRDFTWHIRTYPTKPFFTVQLVYTNKGKQPVRISKLMPWCVGDPRKGALIMGPGADRTLILENRRLFSTFNDYAQVVRGESLSQWNLAAHNPVAGRSIIAGFLTNYRAYTELRMARNEKSPDEIFPIFRAECVYDPPVTLAPGASLESEILYLAVAEADPLIGLERFGKAMAVVNGVRDARPFMPHGWDSWSTAYQRNINETAMLEELAFVDKHLKRYGWRHFAIDAGWECGTPDWEAHPDRFPGGMKRMVEEIHARGMTAGIWLNPFTIPKQSELAQQHPEWMAEPHAMGRVLVGKDNYILDITAPGAYEYVRNLCAKLGQTWGFDALMEADFVYCLLLAQEYFDKNLTRIEVMRRGMQAIREGFGDDKFIMTMTPQLVNAVYAEGIRVGYDNKPVWRSGNILGNWGCVESLTNAIRLYYFTPHLYVADQDVAFFGHEATRERWNVQDQPPLTRNQTLAWMTGAALTGGVLKIGDRFTDLDPSEVAVLRKLLPSVERPARPLDLFQEDSPRIWHLPMRTPAGEWHIVAVFNWDEANIRTIEVPLAAMGIPPDAYYTVFDFWQDKYYGVAHGKIDVQPPAGGVCLLGLRPYLDRPIFLASDRHFTQGAMDHKSIAWDPATRRLEGVFEAVGDTPYLLRMLAPPPYAVQEAHLNGNQAAFRVNGQVIEISFHAGTGGETRWVLQF